MAYVPNTDDDRSTMLRAIGASSVDDLFAAVPSGLLSPPLALPPALSEAALRREIAAIGRRNLSLDDVPSFLGAGIYRHYVPAVVGHVLSRGEFYTSYTPYQPEISQGVLQSIYEFQTLVCQLTSMEVANASMYDAATGLAEAALMAADLTDRRRVVVASSVHPEYRAVLQTYTQGSKMESVTVDLKGGSAPGRAVDGDTAAVIVQYPDFFGRLYDLDALAAQAHAAGALLVVAVDPIALGILRPPGDYDADIVVAEGQALGNAPNYGGPLAGIFATKERYVRRMPGRLVGATRDSRGRAGFVLTMQTREQHIRRERATSNICTNQALNALAATVYLSALGANGLRHVATLCAKKAHYTAKRIGALPGFGLAFDAPFFKEFAIRCPLPATRIGAALLEEGIIGGLALGRTHPDFEDCMLLCITELNTREEIDRLVAALGRVGSKSSPKASRPRGTTPPPADLPLENATGLERAATKGVPDGQQ